MIRGRRVSHIGGVEARHVTVDATIRLVYSQAFRAGLRTTLLLMTLQAAATVERSSLLGRRFVMRIMTGNAAKFLLFRTLKEASTQMHLLEMTDGFVLPTPIVGKNKHRKEIVQRQTGMEIVQITTTTQNFFHAVKMALGADIIS